MEYTAQSLTYPSGRTAAYAFDALGRVNQVSTTADGSAQVVVQNVAYQPFGTVKSFTLGNGQIYSRTVDLDGRIASYTLGAANYQLTFDPASRITGIAQVGNPANANTYGYDAVDRLTSAVLPNSSFGYSYDAVGNRLTKTTGANTGTYAYSATSNQIASLTPSGARSGCCNEGPHRCAHPPWRERGRLCADARLQPQGAAHRARERLQRLRRDRAGARARRQLGSRVGVGARHRYGRRLERAWQRRLDFGQ